MIPPVSEQEHKNFLIGLGNALWMSAVLWGIIIWAFV